VKSNLRSESLTTKLANCYRVRRSRRRFWPLERKTHEARGRSTGSTTHGPAAQRSGPAGNRGRGDDSKEAREAIRVFGEVGEVGEVLSGTNGTKGRMGGVALTGLIPKTEGALVAVRMSLLDRRRAIIQLGSTCLSWAGVLGLAHSSSPRGVLAAYSMPSHRQILSRGC
jgi:hypothetical protein